MILEKDERKNKRNYHIPSIKILINQKRELSSLLAFWEI
jgi:hypothetical protein